MNTAASGAKIVKFYPNPATSNINFELQRALDKSYSLQIFNFMGKKVLELPAGLSGDEHYGGEEFIEAAKRELREETGYEAVEWEQLAGGPPSAGLSNEVVVFFRARNLRKVGEGGGEKNESITVHKVHLPHVAEWLKAREKEGFLIDPKIYAGLYFLYRPST